MSTSVLEERIKRKLAEHEGQIENHRNHLQNAMTEADERLRRYTALADRLTREVLRPRVEKLATFFDNAEILPAEQTGRHQIVCVFKHSERFPATTRLELGFSSERLGDRIALLYHLEILPIFMQFAGQDESWMPLTDIDEQKVGAWFEEKIEAFLDVYLRLETNQHYQDLNIVGDPVCGMTVNKLHAPAQLAHEGVTYYFCVPECRDRFAADPKKYLHPQT